MLNHIYSYAELKMSKSIQIYKKHLSTIRTGRAYISLLDNIKIDYYGNVIPLNQVSIIQVTGARTLSIKPWDKSKLKAIEKSIFEANLGLSIVSNGKVVNISVPLLNEERRIEYVKRAKQRVEEAKILVRNFRREANEMLKNNVKNSKISEDDEKRGLKMVQDITNKFSKCIDELFVSKENEIMTI